MKKLNVFLSVTLLGCLLSNQFVNAQVPAIPPVPPTKPASNVISLFSDVYTPPVSLVRVAWGGLGDITFEEISGDGVIHLYDIDYDHLIFDSSDAPTLVNFSGMTHIHMDIWCTTGADWLQFTLKHGSGLADASITVPYMNPGEWYYHDFPLSDFSGVDLTQIGGLKFTSNRNQRSYYIDNIYFYNNAPTSIDGTETGTKTDVYPRLVKNGLNVRSQDIIKTVQIYNTQGQLVKLTSDINHTAIEIYAGDLSTGTYIVSIEQTDGSKVTEKIIKL